MTPAERNKRCTPEGRKLGAQLVRLTEPEIARLDAAGEPDERCASCAFRAGTVPNGCPQTTLDAAKCVMEDVTFLCHVQPAGTEKRVCHGWFAARREIERRLGRGFVKVMPYPFSPPEPET